MHVAVSARCVCSFLHAAHLQCLPRRGVLMCAVLWMVQGACAVSATQRRAQVRCPPDSAGSMCGIFRTVESACAVSLAPSCGIIPLD